MMKKNRLLLIAFGLLVLGVILVLRLWPRTLDPEQCGELYRKYVDAPGIRASYVKDFPVDDTLTVDALLLQADSDSAWYVLMADFGMPEELIEEYRTNIKLTQKPTASIFTIDKNNLKKRPPRYDTDSRVVSMSYAKKSFCVFLSEDNNVKKSIVYSETVKVSKKNINQQKQKRK